MGTWLDPKNLVELRKGLDLTQEGMANMMGMSLRAYQAVEKGESEYRLVHKLAAERVALILAATKRNPMMAPGNVRSDALDLAHALRGDRP